VTSLCVVGGGLAGTLLAWRLKCERPAARVDLVTGTHERPGATERSGGMVRAFECDPVARSLATRSLAQILSDPVLRVWSAFEQRGSVYVVADPGEATLDVLKEVGEQLPGGERPQLARRAQGFSFAGDRAVAVLEPYGGYVRPGLLRDRVREDFTERGGKLQHEDLTIVPASGRTGYDRTVLATGPWTGELLRRSGLPDGGLRTKRIQYDRYETDGFGPPPFVDETTGLYGRADGPGGILIGLPTQDWETDPSGPPDSRALRLAAAKLATVVLPDTRLVRHLGTVSATDCYSPEPGLALRTVPGAGGHMSTFTGGSGGAVKTALAASLDAARSLLAP